MGGWHVGVPVEPFEALPAGVLKGGPWVMEVCVCGSEWERGCV